MTRKLLLAVLCVAPITAHAQQPIRIGMINVTSGQFADAGGVGETVCPRTFYMRGQARAG